MAAVLYSNHDNNWFLYEVTNSQFVKKRTPRRIDAIFNAFDTSSRMASRVVSALSNGLPNKLKFIFLDHSVLGGVVIFVGQVGAHLVCFPICVVRLGTDLFLHAMFRLGHAI